MRYSLLQSICEYYMMENVELKKNNHENPYLLYINVLYNVF
jgi:hypothetical protein